MSGRAIVICFMLSVDQVSILIERAMNDKRLFLTSAGSDDLYFVDLS